MFFFFAHSDLRVDRIPELREVKPRSAWNKYSRVVVVLLWKNGKNGKSWKNERNGKSGKSGKIGKITWEKWEKWGK